ncbi:restriction endonuclease subunit S [Mycoplasma sp. Ms02]|uniref:restriction endonuclease subunit S n=1 Tax=Mycoplasma sp. Ms02 TaxID=353851 RepID=UPI001C89C24E|nr:restriction endonuclease subunit S [Mycoplasma sp. Ms02]QZE12352.1 restriction endonuclease subunit S [Mycoplasma sp. Ms02]
MRERERANQPQLRFKGFEGEWLDKTFGDITKKVKEKNKLLKVETTLTNSAQFGIVKQTDFFDKDISNIENIGNYYIVEPDTFALNMLMSNNAPAGSIRRNKTGITGIMSPLYYVFKIKNEDVTFTEVLFHSSKWHYYIFKNGNLGARLNRYSLSDEVLKLLPLKMPSIEEQKIIGFKISLIGEDIRIINTFDETLFSLKKTFLSHLFIDNKKEKALFRFKGFKDQYLTKTLNEITHTKIEKNKENLNLPQLSSYANQGIVLKDIKSNSSKITKETHSSYYILERNDFVHNPNISVNKPVGHVSKNGVCDRGLISNIYHAFRPTDVNPDWLSFYFETDKWENYVKVYSESGVRQARAAIIKSDIFQKMQIKLPSDEEQKMVAGFLLVLDKLIKLQKRKQEIMKDLKKTAMKMMLL